jgi:hypothetical protein
VGNGDGRIAAANGKPAEAILVSRPLTASPSKRTSCIVPTWIDAGRKGFKPVYFSLVGFPFLLISVGPPKQ